MKKKKKYLKNNKINFFFKKNKNVLFFIKKLFNSFIKKGKKFLTQKYFMIIYGAIFLKKNNKFKNIHFFNFFESIYCILNPYLYYMPKLLKKKRIMVPQLILNKQKNRIKLMSLIVKWIKISVYKRSEKTLFLKIYSELVDIKLKRSNSIQLKKDYLKSIIDNKYQYKFLKRKNWI